MREIETCIFVEKDIFIQIQGPKNIFEMRVFAHSFLMTTKVI